MKHSVQFYKLKLFIIIIVINIYFYFLKLYLLLFWWSNFFLRWSWKKISFSKLGCSWDFIHMILFTNCYNVINIAHLIETMQWPFVFLYEVKASREN